jgi:hypothetical protein
MLHWSASNMVNIPGATVVGLLISAPTDHTVNLSWQLFLTTAWPTAETPVIASAAKAIIVERMMEAEDITGLKMESRHEKRSLGRAVYNGRA